MGVDLTLLPLLVPDFWASHDILRVERRSELWPEILKLPQLDIPEALSCYFARDPKDGETCYGYVLEDPYGQRLKYTTVGELIRLQIDPSVENSWRNKAVWEYLKQMPETWPIVLYWH